MNDLANHKRANNKKKYVHDFPEGILDVIESDYPNKYFLISEDQTQTSTMFSKEEWIDILTKSRDSFSYHIQQMNLTKKCSGQGN